MRTLPTVIERLFDEPKRWRDIAEVAESLHQANYLAKMLSTHPESAGTYRVRRGSDVRSVWVKGEQITDVDTIEKNYTFG